MTVCVSLPGILLKVVASLVQVSVKRYTISHKSLGLNGLYGIN